MNQPWLEQLEHELSRRGLPRRKIGRLVAEMRDHLDDAQAAACDAGRTADDENACLAMGQPGDVAQAAWENHRATSYAARHPLLAFCVLPIPLTLLGWTLCVLGMIGVVQLAGQVPWLAARFAGQPLYNWPAAMLVLVPVLELLVRVVPPIVAVIVCSRWAAQMGHERRWRLLACLLVAAVAGLFTSELVLPVAPGQGRWALGFMAPGGAMQLMQLAIPLLVGLFLDRRSVVHESPAPVHTAGGLPQARAA